MAAQAASPGAVAFEGVGHRFAQCGREMPGIVPATGEPATSGILDKTQHALRLAEARRCHTTRHRLGQRIWETLPR